MNRALFLTLLFVGCGPEVVSQDEHASAPLQEEPPITTTTEQPLTGFPCDVRQVLQTNCAMCHAGATYVTHFKSRADFLAMSQSGQHQLGVEMSLRIRPGAQDPMPPAGAAIQPTIAERQIIDGWVQAGMPAGACGDLDD